LAACFGSIVWSLAGYFLGGVIENALGIKLENHIEKVVIVVVFLSLLPPIVEFIKHKLSKRRDIIDEAVEIVDDDVTSVAGEH
jgi:hypothetical protein